MPKEEVARLIKGLLAILAVAVILWVVIRPAGLSEFGNSQQPAQSDSEAQAVQVTDIQLAVDYSGNQVAAQRKYDGKVIDVIGTVSDVHLGLMNEPSVVLGGLNMFDRVQAVFEQSQSNLVADVKIGEPVKIRCASITSFVKSPTLSNCTSIQAYDPQAAASVPNPQPDSAQAQALNTKPESSLQQLEQSAVAPHESNVADNDVFEALIGGICNPSSQVSRTEARIREYRARYRCDTVDADVKMGSESTIAFYQESNKGTSTIKFFGKMREDRKIMDVDRMTMDAKVSPVTSGMCKLDRTDPRNEHIACNGNVEEEDAQVYTLIDFDAALDE
jgi:hypothetical protein